MTQKTQEDFKVHTLGGKSNRMSDVDSSLTAHAGLDEIQDSSAARLTVTICCVAVAIALIWASQVSVEEKVVGTGTIEPEGQIERIEHPDGGLVRELFAQANAILPAGGVLLRFDTEQLTRESKAIGNRIATLDSEAQRVRFLLHADESTVPELRGNSDPASEAFWTEQMLFAAQLDRVAAESHRITSQIESIIVRGKIARSEQLIIEEQLLRYEKLGNSRSVRLMDRERLQRELLQLSGLIEETAGRKVELEAVREENTTRRDELIAQRRRDAAARWTKIEDELFALRQSAMELDERIKRAEVRTTKGGQIHRLDVLHPMEVVAAGDVIAEIVPSGTDYRAVINISADRIGSIQVGMNVRLKVLSYDFTRFGTISAQISEISPTSFANDTGETVYRVTVNLPDTVRTGNQPVAIRPGMTVSADILTGERSILSYFLQPIRKIRDQSLSEA